MIVNLDMAVGGHHVDDARLERLAVGDGAHGQRGAARQDVAQVALSAGIEVLGDHNGRGQIARQRGHQGGERIYAAR
jgi:hypothetical protein